MAVDFSLHVDFGLVYCVANKTRTVGWLCLAKRVCRRNRMCVAPVARFDKVAGSWYDTNASGKSR